MSLTNISSEDVAQASKGQEALPEGVYTVEVMDAKGDTSPNGKEYVELTLRIIEDDSFTGRRIWQRLYTDKPSHWYTVPALMALTQGQFNSEDYGDPKSLIDLTCVVRTQNKERDGKVRTEVKTWMPLAEDVQSDTGAAKDSIAAGKKGRANAL